MHSSSHILDHIPDSSPLSPPPSPRSLTPTSVILVEGEAPESPSSQDAVIHADITTISSAILAIDSSKSVATTRHESIVTVTSGYKSYGKREVLKNLSIDVRQGTIYALLGASGCGKTTLLSCVVGTKRLDSGCITFAGQDIQQVIALHGGLRSQVGYMPQELALYKEFTIREALLYFGRIYGMKHDDLLERGRFLVEFLQLPPWSTEIRQMSGGQQRRTSFACALIHSPRLLILDEPTVGVDPILRKSIWEYLSKLVTVTDPATSVIITTHYIDEARSADTVGLMRNGRILAEGSPASLMESYSVESLEHLFLVLSQADGEETKASGPDTGLKTSPKLKEKNSTRIHFPRLLPYPGYLSRLGALTMKNFVYIWRQLLFIFFLLMFPAIQIFLCCWAIGTEPWDLPFGIVNLETENCSIFVGSDGNRTWSCEFMNILGAGETFSLLQYSSEKEARNAMQDTGAVYGYGIISADFSAQVKMQALGSRLSVRQRQPKGTVDQRSLSEAMVLKPPLTVQLDQTSRHITISIQKALVEAYQELVAGVGAHAQNGTRSSSPNRNNTGPIHYEPPIYGHSGPTIVIDYVGPGLLLGVIFFAAISITGLSYVVEKREGMLERSIVAGVSTSEIITAHLLSQCLIVVLQCAICLAVLFAVFRVPIHGPLHWVVVLAVLQAFLGMFAGFVLSSVCDEEKVVMQWSLAITLPMVVVAGIFWPTAGMPEILQYVGKVLVPQTQASEAIRSMLSRGWGLTHPKVWPGFAVSLGYSLGLWALANIFAQRGVAPKGGR